MTRIRDWQSRTIRIPPELDKQLSSKWTEWRAEYEDEYGPVGKPNKAWFRTAVVIAGMTDSDLDAVLDLIKRDPDAFFNHWCGPKEESVASED